MILLGVVVACALTMSVVTRRNGSGRVGHFELALMMGVITAVLGAAILVARKSLFATQVGRMFVGGGMVWAVAIFGHRLLAAHFDMPIGEMLTVDIWLTAALLGMGAIARIRGLGWSSAVSALGALAAAARPDLATPIFMGTAVLVAATVLSFAYGVIK
jgi:hypothetical protein